MGASSPSVQKAAEQANPVTAVAGPRPQAVPLEGMAKYGEARGARGWTYAPWHFLNFLPLPHGHGSLRPTLASWRTGPVRGPRLRAMA